jgi:hypothetical protein
LKVTTSVSQECKPIKEQALFTKVREPDEWDALLERNTYWRTLRVTAWALRFLNNCLARVRRNQKRSAPLVSEEITVARNAWVRRVQQGAYPELQAPGWRIVKLRCVNDWVKELLVSSAFWESSEFRRTISVFFSEHGVDESGVYFIYDKSKILARNCFCINTDRGYSLFKGLYSIYWYCFLSVTFKAL